MSNPNIAEEGKKYLITSESRAHITNNSRKGIPNQKTIISKWLDTSISVPDLEAQMVTVTAKDAVILSMIRKAVAGSEAAAAFLFDRVYGKVKNEPDAPLPDTGVNYALLNDTELKMMAALERKARGLPPLEEGNYIPFTESADTPAEPTE